MLELKIERGKGGPVRLTLPGTVDSPDPTVPTVKPGLWRRLKDMRASDLLTQKTKGWKSANAYMNARVLEHFSTFARGHMSCRSPH